MKNKLGVILVLMLCTCILFVGGYYIGNNKLNKVISSDKINNNIVQAEKLYQLDKFSEAKKYYENALKYEENSDIRTKIELCDNMQSSYDNFNKGIDLFNKKDYLNAYNTLKKVIPEDTKRYDEAKSKANESITIYINDQISQSKSLADNLKYEDAISCITEILNISSDDKNINELKSQAEQLKSQYESKLQAKNEQEAISNMRNIIKVNGIYTKAPNSAGGVDLHIIWVNKSDKIVKYAFFQVVPYNAVGDIQTCEIRDYSNFKGKITGPINPGQSYGEDTLWENAWYNNTIVKAEITGVNIIYMDGTSITLDKEQVQYVLD